MNRLKNSKRLSKLVTVLLLVLVVGAAFAAAPGILDIQATVEVASPTPQDLYVTWHDEAYFVEGDTEQTITIESRNGRTRQRIVWTIEFGNNGTPGPHLAYLAVEANNQGTIDAEIIGATIDWSGAYPIADLGLDAAFGAGTLSDFVGFLPSGSLSGPLVVEVTWDPSSMCDQLDPNDAPFEATFVIEFDYIAA